MPSLALTVEIRLFGRDARAPEGSLRAINFVETSERFIPSASISPDLSFAVLERYVHYHEQPNDGHASILTERYTVTRKAGSFSGKESSEVGMFISYAENLGR